MNFRTVSLFVLCSMNCANISIQAVSNEEFTPLCKQAEAIYEKHNSRNERHDCHAYDFAYGNIQTVKDLEKCVYERYQSLQNSGWDYHDIFIRFRGGFYNYLTFLTLHWDDLKDREKIIFNTEVFEWENIRDYYSEDYNVYCKNFVTMVETIVKNYDKK